MKFKTSDRKSPDVINTSVGLVNRDPKTVSGNLKDVRTWFLGKPLYRGVSMKHDDLADFMVSFSCGNQFVFVNFEIFNVTFSEAYTRAIDLGYKRPSWWQMFSADTLHMHVNNVHRPKPKLTVVK